MTPLFGAGFLREPAFWQWSGGDKITLFPQKLPRRRTQFLIGQSIYRPSMGARHPSLAFRDVLRRFPAAPFAHQIDGYLETRQSTLRYRMLGARIRGQASRHAQSRTIVAGFLWPDMAHARSDTEEQLQAFIDGIESLPEAFVLYDADDRLMLSNSAYAELYGTIADIVRPGVTYEEILLKSVERGQFQTGDDAEEWTRRRMEFHVRREGLFEQHLADGRWIQVSERATPSGGTTSIRADITLLKRREEELNALNRQLEASTIAKSRFLSAVSHELRTPMNGILGIVQSLLLENMKPDQRTRLEIVLGSARVLTALLDDMLDISRIEAGRLEIKPGPIILRDFIDEIATVVCPQAELSGIVIRSSVAPDLPDCLIVDLLRLRQIILNFLSNAIRYSMPGEVQLAARKRTEAGADGDLLRIEISDNGPGIPAEDAERLFRPFERAESSWSDVPEGLGLGLSICRDLAEAMNGRVGVDSVPGHGATFWVDLPLRAGVSPTAAAATQLRAPVDPCGEACLNVLVIDDDGVNRLVAGLLIEKLGHRVTTCPGGEEGLATLSERSFDLVLLDITMPRMGGIDVLRHIRATHGASLPIVAMTANLMSDQIAEYRCLGFQHILPKPLSLDVLGEILRQHTPSTDKIEMINILADLGPVQTRRIIEQAAAAIAELRQRFEQALPDVPLDQRTMHAVHSMRSTAAMLGLGGLSELLAKAEAAGEVTAQGRRGTMVALSDALVELERQVKSLS